MKKRLMSLLMVLSMMLSLLSVTAFAAHEHSWDTWHSDDPTYHWKECANAECDITDNTQKDSYGEHTFTAKSDETNHWQECVCGATKDVAAHVWTAKSDADNHWQECTCGATKDVAGHVWTTKSDASHHWQECACGATKDRVQHTWVKDENNSTATETKYVCSGCSMSKSEHVHNWSAWNTSDSYYHWKDCANANCTITDNAQKEGYGAHAWVKQSSSTASRYDYKCSTCGATKSDHVHVFDTKWTSDANFHWHACTGSGCTETNQKAAHVDSNGNNICDTCDYAMTTGTALKKLEITGLDDPAEGAKVDFDVTVSTDPANKAGTATVAWNRVVSLKDNSSVSLKDGDVFAAGCMYNTGITVYINKNDTLASDFKITLNGENVPFYESYETFKKAVAVYDGKLDVLMAYRGTTTNGQSVIRVCKMFKTLDGNHTHTFATGDNWTESATQHWHACVTCGQGQQDLGKHIDKNGSGLCDVCGYKVHTHTYSSDWIEDANNHWKQCTGCWAKTQVAAHFDNNNTGKCDVCGFVMKAAAGHTHSFAANWTETFAQHYKVCSCGAKSEIAAHADNNNTGKCDVCGYAMTPLANNGVVADTGDSNAVFLWIGVLAVSALGIGGVYVVNKRKKEWE